MRPLRGNPAIPGDKSISHRALILAAISKGTTRITHLLRSEDVFSTLNCLRALGVMIEDSGNEVLVHGQGLHSLKAPQKPLDCGNSGTTMRLLMGLLAGQHFKTTLIGDASLSKRPMNRVAVPLRTMGAQITLTQNNFAPVHIDPSSLKATDCELEVASAQVKSAIMLAALLTPGTTRLSGLIHSRDHSERMFGLFRASIATSENSISVTGGQELKSCPVQVPGDPSTAAFWLGAACLVPGSQVDLKNISLNPTRTGFLQALQTMGADIEVRMAHSGPEPIGTVTAKYSSLQGIHLTAKDIPSLIDEIPILAIVCSQAHGLSEIRGAGELRIKESDRLLAIGENLRNMGVQIELLDDGFRISGPQKLTGAKIQSHHDHRIAMAFAIAGLIAEGKTEIDHPDCVKISYPDFFNTLGELQQ